jgi:hypothetical protein
MARPFGDVEDAHLVDDQSAEADRRQFLNLRSWPAGRRNLWLLALVAGGFFVYQLVAIGLRYPYTTDETIYLSQFNPHVPTYEWAAWRAWGSPVLAAPVALLNSPLTETRLYFVILSSVGLFVAFRPWLKLTDRALAPLAAGLFGGTAVAVYNGSLDLPNYYIALAAVAATGYFVACRQGTDNYRRSLLGLTVAVAFAALVRPSDSLWLVMPLGVACIGLRAWRRPAVVGAIVAGEALGWAPWIIESFFRFGGPFTRLHLASDMLGGTHLYPDLAMVRVYVRLWSTGNVSPVALDVPQKFRGGAPILANVHLAPVGSAAVVWWIAACGAIVASVASALLARRTADRVSPLIMVPLAVGFSMAVPYLFMMRYGQMRFVLSAVALLMLPIAYGVLQLGALGRLGALRRPSIRVLSTGLAAALIVVLVGVQVDLSRPYRTTVSLGDRRFSAVIQKLTDLGVSGPCAIAGYDSYTIAYQVGCRGIGSLSNPLVEAPPSVASALGRGERVAIVLQAAPAPGTFMDRWRLVKVPVRGAHTPMFVYLSPVA